MNDRVGQMRSQHATADEHYGGCTNADLHWLLDRSDALEQALRGIWDSCEPAPYTENDGTTRMSPSVIGRATLKALGVDRLLDEQNTANSRQSESVPE